jgi:hypothetical protein
MNTAKDWHEMCLVKHRLDKAMERIDDMFIETCNGCHHHYIYMSVNICDNENHEYHDTEWQARCTLDLCPIVNAGAKELEK